MSQMEDDASRFLKRVMWSITSGLLWLVFTLGIGLYNGWIVPEKKLGIGNIIFYIWMLIALGVLIWFNHKIWKEKFPHG